MEKRYDSFNAAHLVSMPTRFELEAYLSLSTSELFSLLKEPKTTTVFRALSALSLRDLNDPQFHREENQNLLKWVAKEGITFKNRKLAYNLYLQLYPGDLHQIALGESKLVGYLYFLQEKKYGSVKIGRSLNLERRLSRFITDLPYRVELISYIKSINYEQIEMAFHQHFRHKRLGGEWFDFSDDEIEELRQRKFPEKIVQLVVPD